MATRTRVHGRRWIIVTCRPRVGWAVPTSGEQSGGQWTLPSHFHTLPLFRARSSALANLVADARRSVRANQGVGRPASRGPPRSGGTFLGEEWRRVGLGEGWRCRTSPPYHINFRISSDTLKIEMIQPRFKLELTIFCQPKTNLEFSRLTSAPFIAYGVDTFLT